MHLRLELVTLLAYVFGLNLQLVTVLACVSEWVEELPGYVNEQVTSSLEMVLVAE